MYISDVIGEEYKAWRPGQIIVINAQTGAGKTFFILEKLLPYVAGQGKRLLYLSNRAALKEQVERSYNQKYGDNITVINYQKFERLNLVGRHVSEIAEQVTSCSYFVMDEAHYFLSDAAFNGDVKRALNNIKQRKENTVLIFITATPEYLMLSLAASGIVNPPSPPSPSFFQYIGDCCDGCSEDSCPFEKWERNRCDCYPGKRYYSCMSEFKKSLIIQRFSNVENLLKYKELSDTEYKAMCSYEQSEWPSSHREYFQRTYQENYEKIFFPQMRANYNYYTTPQDYSYIEPVYFLRLAELCECIMKTPEEEKWLVFVSSIKLGEDIEDNLKQLAEERNQEIDSVIISSKSKRKPTKGLQYSTKAWTAYQNIIENSTLINRVTIATAVLDNGINLKDNTLKHIAILEMNQTAFLQMLGRKRIDKSTKERIHVYFWAKDVGEIKTHFNRGVLRYMKFLIELKFVLQFKEPLGYLPYWNNCNYFQSEYQVNGSFTFPFSLYVQHKSPEYDRKARPGDYSFRLFEANPLAVARLTYDYYRLAALLESFSNMSEEEKEYNKETHWLKHQLSWLGLEYTPSKWIDYGDHIKAQEGLKSMLQKKYLTKKEQLIFRAYFIQFARTSHPPLISIQNKASLSTINKVFQRYQVPYQLKSFVKQGKTYWEIIDLYEEY